MPGDSEAVSHIFGRNIPGEIIDHQGAGQVQRKFTACAPASWGSKPELPNMRPRSDLTGKLPDALDHAPERFVHVLQCLGVRVMRT